MRGGEVIMPHGILPRIAGVGRDMGVSRNYVYFFFFLPIIRTIVDWGLHWDPLFKGTTIQMGVLYFFRIDSLIGFIHAPH